MAVDYYSHCRTFGRDNIEHVLERISLRSEKQAWKVLHVCDQYKMTDLAKVIYRVRFVRFRANLQRRLSSFVRCRVSLVFSHIISLSLLTHAHTQVLGRAKYDSGRFGASIEWFVRAGHPVCSYPQQRIGGEQLLTLEICSVFFFVGRLAWHKWQTGWWMISTMEKLVITSSAYYQHIVRPLC